MVSSVQCFQTPNCGFRTTPFRIPLSTKFLNSSINSRVDFPQPGAPFRSFHCSSVVFHQVHNLPLETLQRHTTLYHFTTLNGPPQSFALIMMHLPLILPYVLGQVHLLECIIGTVRNAASNILHFQGIRPISSWVDDHLFIHIQHNFLPEYNQRCRAWNRDIVL